MIELILPSASMAMCWFQRMESTADDTAYVEALVAQIVERT